MRNRLLRGASCRRRGQRGRLCASLCLLPFCAALLLAFPRPAAAAWGEGLFPDAAGHWAAEPINFLGALDIVSGYPDGTCRPEQPLTVVEAVALLLRSTEYSSTGGTGRATRPPAARPPSGGRPLPGRPAAEPALPIPPDATWAAADLFLAVEQGILTPVELQEDGLLQPAPRYRVWQLLARALKVPLDEDASLEFRDAHQVPAEAIAAAATLVRLNLLQGFPDNTLRPLDTITRAEMLALLARMVEDGWLNPAPQRRLEGWVQEVKQEASRSGPAGYTSGSNYTVNTGASSIRSPFPQSPAAASSRYIITLSTPKEGSKDYPLVAGAGIFGISLPTPFGLNNRHVIAVLNKHSELAFIKAYEPRQADQLSTNTGTVEKIIQGRSLQLVLRDLDHDLKTYDVTWGTTVPGSLAALKEGQWVKVALSETTVWNVEPLEVIKATGTIERMEDRKLYLDTFAKDLGDVFLDWKRARLADKDGNEYTGGGLQIGDRVEIICQDWDMLLEIRIRN